MIFLYIFAVLLAVYIAGIVFKKRFSRRIRIYIFTAYEPEGNEMVPARTCGKHRLYHRLLNCSFLPRITGKRSFIPFYSNRKLLRDVEFRATRFHWEEEKGLRVSTTLKNAAFYTLNNPNGDIPDDDTVVSKDDLTYVGIPDKKFTLEPNQILVLRDGSRYTFYYYILK